MQANMELPMDHNPFKTWMDAEDAGRGGVHLLTALPTASISCPCQQCTHCWPPLNHCSYICYICNVASLASTFCTTMFLLRGCSSFSFETCFHRPQPHISKSSGLTDASPAFYVSVHEGYFCSKRVFNRADYSKQAS